MNVSELIASAENMIMLANLFPSRGKHVQAQEFSHVWTGEKISVFLRLMATKERRDSGKYFKKIKAEKRERVKVIKILL